ncbi:MAG: AAA family ATPase [Rhodoferax sp.]|nr:AAA family ATPase [Rhodoferax sp.]
MNTEANKSRQELRAMMTWEMANSAWFYRLGRGDMRRAHNFLCRLEGPMIVIHLGWILFYAVAYFTGPFSLSFNPTPVELAGGINRVWAIAIFTLHTLFFWMLLVYFVKVLFGVPWKNIKYPLVNPVFTSYPLNWIGLHYVVFAAITVWQIGMPSVHIWLNGLEGLFLIYLYYGEPAFGFVPWTRADQAKWEKVMPQRQAAQNSDAAAKEDETYKVPVVARYAKLKFDGIFGMKAVKEKLLEPARAIIANDRPAGEAPRNGFLLFGDPGNGKTVFAEALAGELGIAFLEVTYGPTSSQWMGNMPKVLSKTFEYAKSCAPCVLFIDEIDSFIKSRGALTNNSEDVKITNTLLTEIVSLRTHKVVLIGATNYFSSLDEAAVREGRFDYKVEITPPDEEARIGLIESGIKKYASKLDVDTADAISAAKRWNGFSVARLLAVCKSLPDIAKAANSPRINLASWMAALREVQGRRGKLPTNTKSMAELVLEPATKDALHLIAGRMKDVARIESMGGTLPTGCLFYGPSGTGKTAAARALAKEVGWAFLSIAGPDLVADRTKLDKLYAEAKDMRPTLIFIDEADDVLRSRQFSSTPDLTNKMLTIMDGAEDRVLDVVWIAATNNPDQIDPALVRSGRFTEKVLFSTPPQELIPRHVSKWLKKKGVELAPGLDAFDIAEMLQGQTIADIEGVLQYALNSAISSTATAEVPVITQHNLQQALRMVLNQDT